MVNYGDKIPQLTFRLYAALFPSQIYVYTVEKIDAFLGNQTIFILSEYNL